MFFSFKLYDINYFREYITVTNSQIEYADMLKRVEPLRNELQALEDQAQTNVTAGDEVRDLIAQLEKSIASYKEEYAQLISQAQAIKTDLENVQAKVNLTIYLFESEQLKLMCLYLVLISIQFR